MAQIEIEKNDIWSVFGSSLVRLWFGTKPTGISVSRVFERALNLFFFL